MAGRDTRGPEGKGSMSGRGLGRCAGSDESGYKPDSESAGRGRGFGRRCGQGAGRGYGRGGGGGVGQGRGRTMVREQLPTSNKKTGDKQ